MQATERFGVAEEKNVPPEIHPPPFQRLTSVVGGCNLNRTHTTSTVLTRRRRRAKMNGDVRPINGDANGRGIPPLTRVQKSFTADAFDVNCQNPPVSGFPLSDVCARCGENLKVGGRAHRKGGGVHCHVGAVCV